MMSSVCHFYLEPDFHLPHQLTLKIYLFNFSNVTVITITYLFVVKKKKNPPIEAHKAQHSRTIR